MRLNREVLENTSKLVPLLIAAVMVSALEWRYVE